MHKIQNNLKKDSMREQLLRKFLFYASVVVFCSALPFILSFMLGYKFDRSKFHFTKTGIIAIKTVPANASVSINGLVSKDKTPLTVEELLPGTYSIQVKLANYFPWKRDVVVEAGKVLRFEGIILFPLRPDITSLAKEKITTFFIDEESQTVYYISEAEGLIYRSDYSGKNLERIAPYLAIEPAPQQFKLSPDKKTILYFNNHQIGIITFDAAMWASIGRYNLILDYPSVTINDVFWHSSGKYLIVVTATNIAVLEVVPEAQLLPLANLTRRGTVSFYEVASDILYFLDSQKAPDGRFYDNLYKLEVNTHTPLFRDFMGLRLQEKNQEQKK